VYSGSSVDVRLRLAEHLTCDRRRVTFAERQIPQQIGNRIAFSPSKVGMRNIPGSIANIQEQRGNGVWNRRADASQHAVPIDRGTRDPKHITEVRGVSGLDLDEQDVGVCWKIVRVARLAELVLVLLRQTRIGPIGDDAHGAPRRR